MLNSDCQTRDALAYIHKEFEKLSVPHFDETDEWLKDLFEGILDIWCL